LFFFGLLLFFFVVVVFFMLTLQTPLQTVCSSEWERKQEFTVWHLSGVVILMEATFDRNLLLFHGSSFSLLTLSQSYHLVVYHKVWIQLHLEANHQVLWFWYLPLMHVQSRLPCSVALELSLDPLFIISCTGMCGSNSPFLTPACCVLYHYALFVWCAGHCWEVRGLDFHSWNHC